MRDTRNWPWWIAAGTALIIVGLVALAENEGIS